MFTSTFLCGSGTTTIKCTQRSKIIELRMLGKSRRDYLNNDLIRSERGIQTGIVSGEKTLRDGEDYYSRNYETLWTPERCSFDMVAQEKK